MKRLLTHPTLAAASLLACFGMSASAVTLPPSEDTYSALFLVGKPPQEIFKIAPTYGAAGSLPVSSKRRAYIRFNVGGTGIAASSVTKARLTLYFPVVTKAGPLSIVRVDGDWHEKFTGVPVDVPAHGPVISEILSNRVVAKTFVSVDVTDQVKDWLTNPGTDFGFWIVSDDNVANVLIGAKEGPGSGYPAQLEIQVAETIVGYQTVTDDLSLQKNGGIGIRFLDPTTDTNNDWIIGSGAWSGGNFGVVRHVNGGLVENPGFLITPNGFFGINNYAPSYQLDVISSPTARSSRNPAG